jgi:hypothetical protein
LTFATFEIAAGTPFFHGTNRAVDVIKQGVKKSGATPGGKPMQWFRWFFASYSPALGYTLRIGGEPAVIEFKTTRPLTFADLRTVNRYTVDAAVCPDAERIKALALDGIIIRNTAGSHDYEYGFVAAEDLAYVGYELAADHWLFAGINEELVSERMLDNQDARMAAERMQQAALRKKIEEKLASSE